MTERQDLIRTILLTSPTPYMRAQQIAEVLNRMDRCESAGGVGAALAGLRKRGLVCKRRVFYIPKVFNKFIIVRGQRGGWTNPHYIFWFATERMGEAFPIGTYAATERKARGRHAVLRTIQKGGV